MTTQFDSIYHGNGTELGKIRFAPVGIAWKALESENNVMIQAAEIKYCQWLRVARNFQLRVILKENRRRETFDGFLREDHDKVSQLVTQHYKIQLETKEISVKGWNWGSTDVQGKTAFELPLRSVANSNIAGRTEVSLEFSTAPAAPTTKSKKGRPDELTEIRFYVPGTHTKDDDDETGEKDDDEEVSAAQAFHDLIKDKADIGQARSTIPFPSIFDTDTPFRGRYDIDMFPTFLRLRGKTYDYKILYSSITRLFLLSPDDLHVEMVVGLDPPIRQGQTRYPYLRMLFGRDEDLETEIQMDEETLKTKYDGKLEKKYDGPAHEVVSRIFRGLSGKKIIAPTTFRSHEDMYGVKCNLKAVQGTLFPLEKSLFFVAKQPHLIEFADIHQVVFSRMGSGTAAARTFDLKIISKTGPEVTFTSINKEEHDPIENYLTSKKVRTKNEMVDQDLLGTAAVDDSDDDEMQSVASEGSERPKPRAMDDDDDESEEDADFEASESDGGSPSESDSEVSDRMSIASGDLAITQGPKKKKGKQDGNSETPKKSKKKAKEKEKAEDGPAKKKQKKNDN
ncbi:Structure-specific recognition protein 1 [Ceratobasidium theobromae]|uniref:FACT complex subunit POB3 n=1 Tax=Ceratobasidium theobromae TaxID=1582974 RepID=A0A5N5QW48_9AGAM|nr:Structure-specific recognition protein 1 [Ceratobasidium theobromae]